MFDTGQMLKCFGVVPGSVVLLHVPVFKCRSRISRIGWQGSFACTKIKFSLSNGYARVCDGLLINRLGHLLHELWASSRMELQFPNLLVLATTLCNGKKDCPLSQYSNHQRQASDLPRGGVTWPHHLVGLK